MRKHASFPRIMSLEGKWEGIQLSDLKKGKAAKTERIMMSIPPCCVLARSIAGDIYSCFSIHLSVLNVNRGPEWGAKEEQNLPPACTEFSQWPDFLFLALALQHLIYSDECLTLIRDWKMSESIYNLGLCLVSKAMLVLMQSVPAPL